MQLVYILSKIRHSCPILVEEFQEILLLDRQWSRVKHGLTCLVPEAASYQTCVTSSRAWQHPWYRTECGVTTFKSRRQSRGGDGVRSDDAPHLR